MMTEIGEAIRVGVVFDEEKNITPKWFIWHGKRYDIARVSFSWKVQEGKKILHHFAVTDESRLYELSYDTTLPEWRLETISPL